MEGDRRSLSTTFAVGPDPSRWWKLGTGGTTLSTSTDGGLTWSDCPSFGAALTSAGSPAAASFPSPGVAADTLLADPTRPGVLFVVVDVFENYASAQTVMESADGGATWHIWPEVIPTSAPEANGFQTTWRVLPGRDALLLDRVGSIYTRGFQALEVVRSTGLHALHHHNGIAYPVGPTGLDFTGRMEVDATGTRVLVESSTRGWLLSTDGGTHLRRLGLGMAVGGPAPAFDPSAAGRIYAMHGGVLWRSGDDGYHWSALSPGIPGASGLSVDASGEIYAYGSPGLAISRDAGRTFRRSDAFALPVNVSSIRSSTGGRLLAATDRGVFVIRAGNAWTRFDRASLPLPALDAAPLGHTQAVISVRSVLGPTNSGPTLRLEWSHDGRNWIRVPWSFELGYPSPLASDDGARQVTAGRSWTRDGGSHWHTPRGVQASTPLLLPGTRTITRDAHGGAGTRVLRSETLGRASPLGVVPVRHCMPLDSAGATVFVSCPSSIWRSIDGGPFASLELPPGVQELAAYTHHGNNDELAVQGGLESPTCAGGTLGVLLVSRDAGSSSGPDRPSVHRLVRLRPDRVRLG